MTGMTCAICGSPDDVAVRDGRPHCRDCAERTDWARIIEMVQVGVRLEPTVAFMPAEDASIGADPFA